MRFWHSYVILCLLFRSNNDSEDVQTTLGRNEEDLLDALEVAMSFPETRKEEDLLDAPEVAMSFPKTPARPKGERAQIISLLRALYNLAGGAVNRSYEISGRYTAAENRDLLGSIFGTVASNSFEEYDAEEMQRRLLKSPMFSDVTLSVQNLEHLITQMRRCLYLGYPSHHLVSNTWASKRLY